jgi:hypothetical protein
MFFPTTRGNEIVPKELVNTKSQTGKELFTWPGNNM